MVSNCMSQLLEVSGREACCEQHCRIQRPAPVPFPASPHMPPSRVAFSRRAHDQAADKREKPTRRIITQCPDKVHEGELSFGAASRGYLSSARRAASLAFLGSQPTHLTPLARLPDASPTTVRACHHGMT